MVVSTLPAGGAVTPVALVSVSSQISGQIKELDADFNKEVRRGDVLAVIDPLGFQIAVEQSEAQLGHRQGERWVIDLFHLAGETVLAKLSELMFVEVIRRHIETLPDDSRGWLSGLRDPHVGEALRLIHARPKEEWTLDRLARDVGLSRTAFAGRFTHYVEISPMHYLARWRLQLAGRLLERPDVSIAQAGAEVGYESEAAFNRAFKKFVGVPPGTWRKGRSALLDAQRSPAVVVQ
ncbi:helix-turn-helix domain-containing protein [Mesorhizobium tamadayense]|uniref:Helix-turn-helix domain-containing protein n=2 Tax=Mesorhizobium tamadayense TaxID=425306 RepID=A0A3P3FG87_9HYPH|nr:helix-turn-helix domain-containing protein [Mesorhizobium tamadayense]